MWKISHAILCAALSVGSSALAEPIPPPQTPIPGPQLPPGARLTLLPDPQFKRAWLEAPRGTVVDWVRQGRPYLVCYRVYNLGNAPSLPFHVGGGGLGIPAPTERRHGALNPGRWEAGCLSYPTTPPAGRYRLGLMVDSRELIGESREDNNTLTLDVGVVAE